MERKHTDLLQGGFCLGAIFEMGLTQLCPWRLGKLHWVWAIVTMLGALVVFVLEYRRARRHDRSAKIIFEERLNRRTDQSQVIRPPRGDGWRA